MKQLITANDWNALNIVIMIFVGLSLVLQFVVTTALVFIAQKGEFIDERKRNILIRQNNWLTILVLIVSIINLFISVFFMV